MTDSGDRDFSVAVVVVAAGRGERLGADRPKALVELADEPLVVRAVRGVQAAAVASQVVVVAPHELAASFRQLFDESVEVVAGGDDRLASVQAGLAAITQPVDAVLVHDSARPLTPPEVFQRVVDALRAGALAVVPVVPLVDTVKQVDPAGVVERTVERSALVAAQTPQAGTFAVITDAYRRLGNGDAQAFTDDASVMEAANVQVETVAGDRRSLKITTPFDLLVAEAILAEGNPND